MRFGLCCLFNNEPVSFRTTTAKALSALNRDDQLQKLSAICTHNAENLLLGVKTVQRLGIGSFRIMSPLFPRMTHPEVGYRLSDLPAEAEIASLLQLVRSFSQEYDIRLSFHPDQFVVLSSPHATVVENSLSEIEYHAFLGAAVGADVVNIHGGGVYGDKAAALQRFVSAFADLSAEARRLLTLENDDISYTVRDLLPVCEQLSIPLVYDVHHHRCNPDGLSEEEATRLAGETWQSVSREQYCHISSPRSGGSGGNLRPHADYIDIRDFPECWYGREMTVDLEAKAKELAVLRLMDELKSLKPR